MEESTLPIWVSDLFVQLIATLIGVIVGAIAAISINEHEKDKTKDERIKLTLHAITSELSYNVDELVGDTIFWDVNTQSVDGTSVIISSYSFQSIIHSGDFASLSSELQVSLNDLYLIINELNTITDTIFNYPYTTAVALTTFQNQMLRLMGERNLVKQNFVNSIQNSIIELRNYIDENVRS
ncbi:MAG: hypothetical protein AABX32_01945 [Nanoarchaeota archaeon]